MQQVTIENPILNSPFKEPTRYFKFSDYGITNEIIEDRRISSYFIPIPKAKKRTHSSLFLMLSGRKTGWKKTSLLTGCVAGLVSGDRPTIKALQTLPGGCWIIGKIQSETKSFSFAR